MQYESQIQDNERICTESCGDNTEKIVDSRPIIQYYCNKCSKCVKKAGYTAEYTHEQHIKDCWPNGIENVDYVECKLCKFAGLKITMHVKKEHNIDRIEYEKKYGSLKCSKSLEKIKVAGKNNGDWINRKKEAGEDLSEYKSKMGTDADVCVVSFKVSGKEPSADLVSFIEKGYDYVLDADVSSGEKEGGDYLVFVELDRTAELPKQIMQIMEDLMNLTEQDVSDWRVRYYKSTEDHDLTEETLEQIIPLSPEAYSAKYDKEDEELPAEEPEQDITKDLDQMKADRKSTRLNSSHVSESRMPSSA